MCARAFVYEFVAPRVYRGISQVESPICKLFRASDPPAKRAKYSAPPQRVARAILKASRKNRALVFPTWSAWLLYFADRWLPWLSQAGNIRYRDKVLSRRRPA
jgi:hypothetical protein